MTVKDLKAAIANLPDDTEVWYAEWGVISGNGCAATEAKLSNDPALELYGAEPPTDPPVLYIK